MVEESSHYYCSHRSKDDLFDRRLYKWNKHIVTMITGKPVVAMPR